MCVVPDMGLVGFFVCVLFGFFGVVFFFFWGGGGGGGGGSGGVKDRSLNCFGSSNFVLFSIGFLTVIQYYVSVK